MNIQDIPTVQLEQDFDQEQYPALSALHAALEIIWANEQAQKTKTPDTWVIVRFGKSPNEDYHGVLIEITDAPGFKAKTGLIAIGPSSVDSENGIPLGAFLYDKPLEEVWAQYLIVLADNMLRFVMKANIDTPVADMVRNIGDNR